MTEPIRPGVIIREMLTSASITGPKAAEKMGISPMYLYNTIRGIANRRLSSNMISRLPTLFEGTDEEYWRKLSDDYYEHKKGVNDARV